MYQSKVKSMKNMQSLGCLFFLVTILGLPGVNRCTVKKNGRNQGKVFYVCSKVSPCKFFQWAEDVYSGNCTAMSSTSAERRDNTYEGRTVSASPKSQLQNESSKCSCGIPIISLTVRKDGPNKGRPFYTCSNRDASCGFFKWNDKESSQGVTSGSNSISGSRPQSSHEFSGESSKKRKCGLCRQEGHTRIKCPRKAEFEY